MWCFVAASPSNFPHATEVYSCCPTPNQTILIFCSLLSWHHKVGQKCLSWSQNPLPLPRGFAQKEYTRKTKKRENQEKKSSCNLGVSVLPMAFWIAKMVDKISTLNNYFRPRLQSTNIHVTNVQIHSSGVAQKRFPQMSELFMWVFERHSFPNPQGENNFPGQLRWEAWGCVSCAPVKGGGLFYTHFKQTLLFNAQRSLKELCGKTQKAIQFFKKCFEKLRKSCNCPFPFNATYNCRLHSPLVRKITFFSFAEHFHPAGIFVGRKPNLFSWIWKQQVQPFADSRQQKEREPNMMSTSQDIKSISL